MDLIDRQKTIDALMERFKRVPTTAIIAKDTIENLPSAQPEVLACGSGELIAQVEWTELKQEFLRMASYIDVLLECSDEQRETLLNFISKLAQYMPWTERD